MIHAKFCLNWPSGFRGENFWKSLQTNDGRQVMAIAHTGELKINAVFNHLMEYSLPVSLLKYYVIGTDIF